MSFVSSPIDQEVVLMTAVKVVVLVVICQQLFSERWRRKGNPPVGKLEGFVADELDRVERVLRLRGIACVDLLGERQEHLMLATPAGGLFVDVQPAFDLAAVDVVEPLATLLIESWLEASCIDVEALAAFDVDVGALGMFVTTVADELVQTDLVVLGLGIDARSKGGEEDAQDERDETSHDGLVFKDLPDVSRAQTMSEGSIIPEQWKWIGCAEPGVVAASRQHPSC